MKILDKIGALLPKEYTYTAGAPDSGGGFKFVVDATPQLQKTITRSALGFAALLGTAIVVSAAVNYSGRRRGR